jgi:D-alanyl-D-alanine carboxypeptidase
MRDDDGGELVASESAMLWNTEADVIKYEKNGFERRSIASLTKLMAAMVAIDQGVDWGKEMTIGSEEWRIGGRLVLAPDEFVTMTDLLHASLMGSANNATLAFVRGVGVEEKEFIYEMNRKAIELSLEQTEFVDVTGLDPGNLSTAYEVARIAEVAFNDYPIIKEVTSKEKYGYVIGGSGREHTIVNTNNMMVDYGYPLSGSKTGYLYEANFCLVVQGTGDSSDLIAVVLGAPSEWDSMSDVRTLLEMED